MYLSQSLKVSKLLKLFSNKLQLLEFVHLHANVIKGSFACSRSRPFLRRNTKLIDRRHEHIIDHIRDHDLEHRTRELQTRVGVDFDQSRFEVLVHHIVICLEHVEIDLVCEILKDVSVLVSKREIVREQERE
jgi:hypothetical protein